MPPPQPNVEHPVTDANFEAQRNEWAPVQSRGELPHLYKEGSIYFVKFRLFDAVGPKVELQTTPSSPLCKITEAERIALSTEPPLRAGSCILSRPDIASLVAGTLLNFANLRYVLHAWCIMPNHAHVVIAPTEEHTLPKILHNWKSYTAHTINRRLGQKGAVWERESFDHLIRNLPDFERFVEYTVNNPVVAGLCATPEEWPYSSACRSSCSRDGRTTI